MPLSAAPAANAPASDAAASASPGRGEYTKRAAASQPQPRRPTQSAHATPTARSRGPGARDGGPDAQAAAGSADGGVSHRREAGAAADAVFGTARTREWARGEAH